MPSGKSMQNPKPFQYLLIFTVFWTLGFFVCLFACFRGGIFEQHFGTFKEYKTEPQVTLLHFLYQKYSKLLTKISEASNYNSNHKAEFVG